MDYKTVLKIVHNWPQANRLMLVQDILKGFEVDLQSPQSSTLSLALGLLQTTQPSPTDDDIKTWINDHRMEKYG